MRSLRHPFAARPQPDDPVGRSASGVGESSAGPHASAEFCYFYAAYVRTTVSMRVFAAVSCTAEVLVAKE
jgi:hypothetical protein